jgi:hypothetical protein
MLGYFEVILTVYSTSSQQGITVVVLVFSSSFFFFFPEGGGTYRINANAGMFAKHTWQISQTIKLIVFLMIYILKQAI